MDLQNRRAKFGTQDPLLKPALERKKVKEEWENENQLDLSTSLWAAETG